MKGSLKNKIPEIRSSRWALPRTTASIFHLFTNTVTTTVLRKWIVAFAVFLLDSTAAGSRTFSISSPFAPLAVNRLEIETTWDALASITPFVSATGSAISPRHMLGTTVIVMVFVRCGAPQSSAHCLADNQPTAQFISILKHYVRCALFTILEIIICYNLNNLNNANS